MDDSLRKVEVVEVVEVVEIVESVAAAILSCSIVAFSPTANVFYFRRE